MKFCVEWCWEWGLPYSLQLRLIAAVKMNQSIVLFQLSHTLKELDKDKSVGAIVITGSERAFAGSSFLSASFPLLYSSLLQLALILRRWFPSNSPTLSSEASSSTGPPFATSASPLSPLSTDSRYVLFFFTFSLFICTWVFEGISFKNTS